MRNVKYQQNNILYFLKISTNLLSLFYLDFVFQSKTIPVQLNFNNFFKNF